MGAEHPSSEETRYGTPKRQHRRHEWEFGLRCKNTENGISVIAADREGASQGRNFAQLRI